MLLAAVGLLAVPGTIRRRAQGLMGAFLRPGQVVAQGTTLAVIRYAQRLLAPPADRDELERLRNRVRQLHVAVAELQARADARTAAAGFLPSSPLLEPVLHDAAVIGSDAAALLRQEQLLSAGTATGIHAGSLVLGPTTLDQGERSGLESGQLVFLGRSVVGRISRTGPHTSVLQLITDPGFRQLAEVQRVRDGHPLPATRGILVGSGEGHCRLTRVAAGEDMQPGDRVVTSGFQPLLPHPLTYGTVARCTHHQNKLYWEIIVQPTADLTRLHRVFVLGVTVNPDRIADTPKEDGR